MIEQLCDSLSGAISGKRISLTISGGMWSRVSYPMGQFHEPEHVSGETISALI